jgi:hypothetical protein
MPRKLTRLRIDEVSSVDKGAGEGVKIVLMKRDSSAGLLMFNDIIRKAADDDPNDDKVSSKLTAMVDAMIAAAPSLGRQQAAHYLLHNAHGRRLAEHLNNLSKHEEPIMPQVDILKIASILEAGLNAQVTKRDGESFAQAFTRKYENDIDFRRQWASITEAKHTVALSKGMATLMPTSVGVDSINDVAEAVRQLQEMAAKNGRSFESVFADPANAALAAKTYTLNHRSSVNTEQ